MYSFSQHVFMGIRDVKTGRMQSQALCLVTREGIEYIRFQFISAAPFLIPHLHPQPSCISVIENGSGPAWARCIPLPSRLCAFPSNPLCPNPAWLT